MQQVFYSLLTTRYSLLFLLPLLFGVAYTQAPLYYSNQNQYFLHGLANAGLGDLKHDWLANTIDPTPIFSALVSLTSTYLPRWVFHVYYLLMLGLYCYCLVDLGLVLTPSLTSPPAKLGLLTLLVLFHAGIVRWASTQLFGIDYPWYAQSGLAGQYVLGFGLQPSVSGVFLIASLSAFVRDHLWRAVLWACLAPTLHATYFLSAALLVLGYMRVRYRSGGWRQAILLGTAALVLVIPSLWYDLITFAPTDKKTFDTAQEIVAHIRIPHHAELGRWLDGIAVAQILWVVLAIYLARRSTIFAVLLTMFLGAFLLTLVQVITDNDTLALLFPWRTSAILVPVATAIVLAKFMAMLCKWQAAGTSGFIRLISTVCIAVLIACAAGGVAIYWFDLGYRSNDSELPLLNFVHDHRRPGEVYLLPVKIPTGSSRGAFSTNFTPPPRGRDKKGLIAIDLQRFRIDTGAAIYVDFKSIPYQDEEVLEWFRRIKWCEDMYSPKDKPADKLRQELQEEGITHVVTPAGQTEPFAGLGEPWFRDDNYCVYKVAKKDITNE